METSRRFGDNRPKHRLFVENDPGFVHHIQQILATHGYQSTLVAGGGAFSTLHDTPDPTAAAVRKPKDTQNASARAGAVRVSKDHPCSDLILIETTQTQPDHLLESQKQYQLIAENTGDVVCLLDKDLSPVYISPSSERVFGYTMKDFSGTDVLFMIHPDDKPRVLEELLDYFAQNNRHSHQISFRIVTKSGEVRWIEASADRIVDESGELEQIVTVHRDVTKRVNAEQELKQALEDKQLLMSELNHRVKNNLNLVLSLVHLKSDAAHHETALKDLESQIMAVYKVYELLHNTECSEAIRLDLYLDDLFSGLLRQWTGAPILFDADVDAIGVSPKVATTVGITVSELTINAMKYGLPEADEPRLRVSCKLIDDCIHLAFTNNGKPFPDDVSIDFPETFGLQLVTTSVRQIGGTIELNRSPEPTFTICFPYAKPA